jgi:hypothetical protein
MSRKIGRWEADGITQFSSCDTRGFSCKYGAPEARKPDFFPSRQRARETADPNEKFLSNSDISIVLWGQTEKQSTFLGDNINHSMCKEPGSI